MLDRVQFGPAEASGHTMSDEQHSLLVMLYNDLVRAALSRAS